MKIQATLLVGAVALLITGCNGYPHRSAAPGGVGQVGITVEGGVAELMPEGVRPRTLTHAQLCDGGDLASCNIIADLLLAPAEEAHGEAAHAEDDAHAEEGEHAEDAHAEEGEHAEAGEHGDEAHGEEGEHGGGHHGYAAVPHNPELAYELLGSACEGGFTGACWRLGAEGQSLGEVGPAELMHNACASGDIAACYDTALLVSAHTVSAPEDAAWYMARACTGGVRDACLASAL